MRRKLRVVTHLSGHNEFIPVEPHARSLVWPNNLSAPVDPMETHDRMRAQSILSGPIIGQCPPLTLEQARDVLRWYAPLPWPTS
jgi:hypothetical protein